MKGAVSQRFSKGNSHVLKPLSFEMIDADRDLSYCCMLALPSLFGREACYQITVSYPA